MVASTPSKIVVNVANERLKYEKSSCENKYLNSSGVLETCNERYNCCDCGGVDCGCGYCFSCQACPPCLTETSEA